jgi:uncharacterized protein
MSFGEPSVRPDDTVTPPAAPEARGAPYWVPWRVLDAVGIVAVYLFIAIIADVAVVELVLPRLDPAYSEALRLAVSALAVILAVVVWLPTRNRSWLRHVFGSRPFTSKDLAWAVAAGVAMWVVLILGLGNLLTWLVQERGGELPPVQENLQGFARDPRTAPILLLSAGLLAPIGEEMFFRGVLFPALRKRLGSWPGIGLSGLLWALVHVQSTRSGYLLTITIIFPVGMVLALLYERRPTLVAPIFAHAVYNCIQIGLLIAYPTA